MVNLDAVVEALEEAERALARSRHEFERERELVAWWGENSEMGETKLAYLKNSLASCRVTVAGQLDLAAEACGWTLND